jgi:hypothetical protein
MSMKNSIETIGNRTRDLPACNAAPQSTAPPRDLFSKIKYDIPVVKCLGVVSHIEGSSVQVVCNVSSTEFQVS